MGLFSSFADVFSSATNSIVKGRQKFDTAVDDDHVRGPGKAILSDPLVWAFASQYYVEKPNTVNYALLRYLSRRDLLLAVIQQTRINQLQAFFSPRQHDEAERSVGTGFRVKLRAGVDKKHTKAVIAKENELTHFINKCGREDIDAKERVEDRFGVFATKFCRDSLQMDQACAEKQLDAKGNIYQFYAVDGATIRIQKPHYDTQGRKYVQIERGRVVAEFEPEELMFCPRNVSSDIYQFGYGMSEIELAVREITTNIGISLANEKQLDPGSIPRGIMSLENAEFDGRNMRELENQWKAQMLQKGRHRLPFISLPRGGKLNFISFPQPTEMEYQAYIEHLANMLCALYSMDTVEINMTNRGGPGSSGSLFSSSNEVARLTNAKDKGLRPFLSWLETCINLQLMPQIDGAEDFEFIFIGLDNKSDQEKTELATKQVKAFKTVNEIRLENGLEEREDCDIVLDNVWMQAKNAQQQQEAQENGEGMPEGEEGIEGDATEDEQEDQEGQESWETVAQENEGDEGW